jgi:hypothetical protein
MDIALVPFSKLNHAAGNSALSVRKDQGVAFIHTQYLPYMLGSIRFKRYYAFSGH